VGTSFSKLEPQFHHQGKVLLNQRTFYNIETAIKERHFQDAHWAAKTVHQSFIKLVRHA
jgi:hypothetical protein